MTPLGRVLAWIEIMWREAYENASIAYVVAAEKPDDPEALRALTWWKARLEAFTIALQATRVKS